MRYTSGGHKLDAPSNAAQAAQTLFQAHGTAIYRFASVLLGHHQDAEDVLQEAFVKLLTHLRAGGDVSNLRGWLFTVAANAARDRQRRRRRWIPWSPRHDPGVGPHISPDEDGQLAAVREVLRRLPDRDRLLLALRAQGLSYREIAAAARIKPASVGRLLARAVARWERTMKEDNYEVSQRCADSGGRR